MAETNAPAEGTRTAWHPLDAARFIEMLDEEELDVYDRLFEQIRLLRQDPETMHLKDLDTAEQSLAAPRRRFIANAPIEDRLDGLTPEQLVARLTPEERIAGLDPEELAAALPPEILEFLAQKAKSRSPATAT